VETYIVAYGSIFGGMSFVGPFDSFEDGEEWADHNGGEWWVIQLDHPDN